MSVYFIRAGNFIKIGYADDPQRRLKELQTGNPNVLEMLGVILGDIAREGEIHTIFSDFRVNGEWFELTTDILAFVQQEQKSRYKPKPGEGVSPNRAGAYRRNGEGWVEYIRNKNGERYYARERWWEQDNNGNWKKRAKYRKDLPSLSPVEYQEWRVGK